MADTLTFLNSVSNQRAWFFLDPDGKTHRVEITTVGDPNTSIQKVTPDHIARWPREWAEFQTGNTSIEVPGTNLLEVPGIDRVAAMRLKLKGVRVVEELANLNDAAASSLGMGGITMRDSAKQLLELRRLQKLEALMARNDDDKSAAPIQIKRGPGRPPKQPIEEPQP